MYGKRKKKLNQETKKYYESKSYHRNEVEAMEEVCSDKRFARIMVLFKGIPRLYIQPRSAEIECTISKII